MQAQTHTSVHKIWWRKSECLLSKASTYTTTWWPLKCLASPLQRYLQATACHLIGHMAAQHHVALHVSRHVLVQPHAPSTCPCLPHARHVAVQCHLSIHVSFPISCVTRGDPTSLTMPCTIHLSPFSPLLLPSP